TASCATAPPAPAPSPSRSCAKPKTSSASSAPNSLGFLPRAARRGQALAPDPLRDHLIHSLSDTAPHGRQPLPRSPAPAALAVPAVVQLGRKAPPYRPLGAGSHRSPASALLPGRRAHREQRR